MRNKYIAVAFSSSGLMILALLIESLRGSLLCLSVILAVGAVLAAYARNGGASEPAVKGGVYGLIGFAVAWTVVGIAKGRELMSVLEVSLTALAGAALLAGVFWFFARGERGDLRS